LPVFRPFSLSRTNLLAMNAQIEAAVEQRVGELSESLSRIAESSVGQEPTGRGI
jgi:hypothetical protein